MTSPFYFNSDIFNLEVAQLSQNTTCEAKTAGMGLCCGDWEGRDRMGELLESPPEQKGWPRDQTVGVQSWARYGGKCCMWQERDVAVCGAVHPCYCMVLSSVRGEGGPSPAGQMSGGAAFPSKWQKLLGRWWTAVDRAQHEMESHHKRQKGKIGISQHWHILLKLYATVKSLSVRGSEMEVDIKSPRKLNISFPLDLTRN